MENPEKRLSWEEYFNHPFFVSDNKASTTNSHPNNLSTNSRYKLIKEFNIGIKNKEYICYIDKDTKRKKRFLLIHIVKIFLIFILFILIMNTNYLRLLKETRKFFN